MKNKAVDKYIADLTYGWQQDFVRAIRITIHQADPDIEELIKWGTPAFYHKGPVCWLFCATGWVHFAFTQGALLDDSHGLFVEDENTTSKAKRTMKFRDGENVPVDIIVKLVREAVANNVAGRKIKFEQAPKEKILLPEDMRAKLQERDLTSSYWERPYYQQKGYIQWIDQAKQSATRERRIHAMLEELEDGTYMPPKHK